MFDLSGNAFLFNLRNHIFASPLYAWALGCSKGRAVQPPLSAFPGDAVRGQSLRFGDFIDGSWTGSDLAADASHTAHGFSWLTDVQASGLDTAASIAREITATWIHHHRRWQQQSWQPEVLSERLCNWISASAFLLSGAEDGFRLPFEKALAQQAAHLLYSVRLRQPQVPGFAVEKALIYCGTAIEEHPQHLATGIDHLQQAVSEQVFADGGHASRNPSLHLRALRNLIDIRTVLQSHPSGAPVWLQASIDKMAPMLRAFVLGDGHLATLNGANLFDATEVDRVLKASATTGRAVTNSPHSGFQRLAARTTVVIMDAGVAAGTRDLPGQSAGTLGFEMSVGKQRLIVNCGLPVTGSSALLTALRGTPAHSTLGMEDMNSSEISASGGLGPRRAWRTQALRREIDKNTLIEASHDGYLLPFGLSHRRALYLSSDGNELRGEDAIHGDGQRAGVVRFHLHPSVQASLVEAGDSILLKFGKTGGWRFRSSSPDLKLEPSLYHDRGQRRQCQQIVLAFTHTGPDSVIKWRFSKDD